jgi:hypothetical protein
MDQIDGPSHRPAPDFWITADPDDEIDEPHIDATANRH